MFNETIKPMLLKEIEKPFNDRNYIYELKFDGIRAIIHASNKGIKITSRNGLDITYLYPELESIKEIVKKNKVILDGEIVAFDKDKPSFHKLQERIHLKNKSKIEKVSKDIPVSFICFDILYENKPLIQIPLMKRKKILEKYKDTNYFIKTTIYNNGIELFKKVKKLDLEGIIAKEKNSLYYPGFRENCWLKIKNFKVDEFIVHGFIFNTNKYSLLIGEYHKKKLFYIGKVSIGNNNPKLAEILKQKKSTNKFINFNELATYIEPTYKIKVHYMERSQDNVLRQPFIR